MIVTVLLMRDIFTGSDSIIHALQFMRKSIADSAGYRCVTFRYQNLFHFYFIDPGIKIFEGHFTVLSARSDEQIINARSGHRNCRLSSW